MLEQLLAGGKHAGTLPFAVAAFLLEEPSLSAAVADGLITADRSWMTAARRPGDLTLHWTPTGQPAVPSAVVRALGLAEAARRVWTGSRSGDLEKINRNQVEVLADDWRANGSPAPERLDAMVAMILAAPAPPPAAASGGPDWLVSVSINVAGSTEAKTRLKTLPSEPDRQMEFLRDFYRQFLQQELRFYDQLTTKDGAFQLRPLLLDQIFYVKGIGDEVWLLIEPKQFDDEHLKHLLARVLNAAQAALSNWIVLAETAEAENGFDFDPAATERAIESGVVVLDLPFNVSSTKLMAPIRSDSSGRRSWRVG